MSNRNIIGTRIENLRKERGLTQEQVAKELKVKRETVGQWEKGSRDIKTKATIELSRFFGVSTDFILGESEYRKKNVGATTVADIGLSEAAATKLMSLHMLTGFPTSWDMPKKLDRSVVMLNNIIEHKNFLEFLYQVDVHKKAKSRIKKSDTEENAPKSFDAFVEVAEGAEKLGFALVKQETAAEMSLSLAMKHMRRIISDMPETIWTEQGGEPDTMWLNKGKMSSGAELDKFLDSYMKEHGVTDKPEYEDND